MTYKFIEIKSILTLSQNIKPTYQTIFLIIHCKVVENRKSEYHFMFYIEIIFKILKTQDSNK